MATKHYLEMDGLRGVAAVSVALYHQQRFFGGAGFFGHGYLAVDFFFMLSGFVLFHSYGERLKLPNSFAAFIRDRIIRLYPLLLAGALLGLAAALATENVKPHQSDLMLVAAALLNALCLPALWMQIPFYINDPVWSLFMELSANLVFALSMQFVTLSRLLIFVTLSVLIVLVLDVHYGYFAVGRTRHTMLGGLPRVCASFSLGVLLYLVHRSGVLQGGGKRWWIAPVLVASFIAVPTKSPASVWYDPLVVFFLYPALILASAGSRDIMPRIARLSGEISYPLYVIHVPLMQLIQYSFLYHGYPTSRSIVVISLIASLAAAMVLLLFYDQPLRAYLRTRLRTPAAQPGVEIISASTGS